jgi:hypothetical protein
LYEGQLAGLFEIAHVDLHDAGISYASMHKARAIDDRLDEGHLVIEVAVDKLEAGIPVGEIGVESQIGKPADEAHRAPGVLEDRGTVGFDVQRYRVAH